MRSVTTISETTVNTHKGQQLPYAALVYLGASVMVSKWCPAELGAATGRDFLAAASLGHTCLDEEKGASVCAMKIFS